MMWMWFVLMAIGGIAVGVFLFWLMIVTTKTYH
jgi:hypothetical protein